MRNYTEWMVSMEEGIMFRTRSRFIIRKWSNFHKLCIQVRSLTCIYISTIDFFGQKNHFVFLSFFPIQPGLKDTGCWKFMKNFNFSGISRTIPSNRIIFGIEFIIYFELFLKLNISLTSSSFLVRTTLYHMISWKNNYFFRIRHTF